jgi:tetratricopeptide (TPR) repeat protein
LEPKFARRVNGETKMSYEDEKKIKDDLNDFFENARLIDNQLRNTNENQENEQSFSNGSKARYNQDSSSSSLAEKLEKEKIAENERLKGNEFVKAKEYSNAVGCYTRSIELNGKEPFTFANRAMAYLKMKLYKNAIEDSNSALELKPGYLKAIHRRGKAYAALGEYEKAIKDF